MKLSFAIWTRHSHEVHVVSSGWALKCSIMELKTVRACAICSVDTGTKFYQIPSIVYTQFVRLNKRHFDKFD